ncbi:MAG: nucleoside-diphosphate sugar epimerase [Gammaproteobacteria bacterium HGW-Gammaproteobacteria-3]|nr:MAG: nucleoside-diphosphate sugar epimerase [Gammaproteobacteria bacterium HGW-Gammaproteobacteria-3]
MPDITQTAASTPLVWVLLGEGAGGNAQMLQLAKALGWPYSAKQMRYNRLNHLPNPLLGASAVTVDRKRSDSLTPPWPDLVIAASRRAAPVARWLKKRSGGRTRLVHLLHTQAPLHHFDLIVTLPQYCLPHPENVLHNTLPLNTLDPERLQRAALNWQPRLAHLPRPWIAVLVGGNSSSYRLDAAIAARLGEHASAAADAAGGSLLLTTSPRTPEAAAAALFSAVNVPAYTYPWRRGDADNPYSGFLALADRFIVTADSASLPAEACATGKPVALFDWQQKPRLSLKLRLPLLDKLRRSLIYWGWFKPRRDFGAFHRALAARGLLGDTPPKNAVADDLARVVTRIRQLMAQRDKAQTRYNTEN